MKFSRKAPLSTVPYFGENVVRIAQLCCPQIVYICSPSCIHNNYIHSHLETIQISKILSNKHTHAPKIRKNGGKTNQTKKKSVKVFINGTKCIFKFSRERSKTKEKRHLKVYLRQSNTSWDMKQNKNKKKSIFAKYNWSI